MNNFIYSLILLGHGFKPFGYAILDELFPFFIKFSKIKINLVSIFIILISTIIFFQSVKGLMINLSDYLYKFHMIWISICLLLLTKLENIDFKNRKIFYMATAYLLINMLFIIIQQINFLLSGGQLKCADLHHTTPREITQELPNSQESCFLDYAFWQEFWTGTAYSSLGLFISLILILSYLNKKKLKILFISIFFIIIIFQETKTGLLYLVLLIPFILINKFQIKKFIYFVLIMITVLCSDLILTYFNNYFTEIASYDFVYIAQSSYVYGLIVELSNILSTGNFTFFLDNGRTNQIIGIKEYLVQNNFFETLLGTYSGSHRFNLINYISSDSSGILRPIGIVVLIYDWGLIFLFMYVSLVIYNLIKINLFFKHSIFKNLTFSAVYLFISANPLITNLNDSVLFWLIIFFPMNILVKSLMRVNI